MGTRKDPALKLKESLAAAQKNLMEAEHAAQKSAPQYGPELMELRQQVYRVTAEISNLPAPAIPEGVPAGIVAPAEVTETVQ